MRTTRLAGVGVVMTAAAIALPLSVPTSVAAETTRPTSAPAATSKPKVTTPVVPTKRPLTAAQLQAKRAAAIKRARYLRAVRHNNWLKTVRFRLVKFALSRVHGGQYVAGAEGPWAFDCSGFTKYVYRAVTGIDLPHYSGAQLNYPRGFRVGLRQLAPGDLLAWGSNGSQHVSMYIGRGYMIGANNPSRDVVVEPMMSDYWAPRYAGARRIIY